MDGMRQEPEEDDGDAARAFEALRAEVAALRRGVELVYRQGQQAAPATAGPDYSPTLGKMEKALQAIAVRAGGGGAPAGPDADAGEALPLFFFRPQS